MSPVFESRWRWRAARWATRMNQARTMPTPSYRYGVVALRNRRRYAVVAFQNRLERIDAPPEFSDDGGETWRPGVWDVRLGGWR